MTTAASTVSTLQSFPNPGSIPPITFYNILGLANWLNINPKYKSNFAETKTFPYLYPQYYSTVFSTFLPQGYNPENVPLTTNVINLSQYEALKYKNQIKIFHKVYATNSNAYINYISSGGIKSPIYYTFQSYKEKYEYSAAVQLINKLYPFQDMANAANWIIPFPIYM